MFEPILHCLISRPLLTILCRLRLEDRVSCFNPVTVFVASRLTRKIAQHEGETEHEFEAEQ